jgi:hypothetical protein
MSDGLAMFLKCAALVMAVPLVFVLIELGGKR